MHHPSNKTKTISKLSLKPVRSAIVGVMISLANLPAHITYAADSKAEQQTVRQYDIEGGPLAEVINLFASAAGVVLTFNAEDLQNKTSPGLHGQFSVNQGFAKLLNGTGLQVKKNEDGSFILKKLPAPISSEKISTLSEVTVNAKVLEEDGVVKNKIAKRTLFATKTDTPLIETPQSISVVGAQEINDIQAQNLMDGLGYVAGIARVEGLDRTTESLLLRGFEAWADNGSIYRDGTKYSVNLNNGTQEPYGMERIEVLKGASSVLYGAAAPGGIINTVSKKPTIKSIHELNVQGGSFNRKQVSGDFAGALDEEGIWAYRLVFLDRNSDTFIDHVSDDRAYVAPSISWRPTDQTSLTILSEFQKDRTAYVYGLPAQGTVLFNPNGHIQRSRFVGEPGFDKFDNTRWSIGYLFEHAFSDQLKIRNNTRYYRQFNDRPFVYIDGLTADFRSTDFRGAAYVRDQSRAITSDTSVQYKWGHGEIAHTSLVGLDITRQRHQQALSTASADALDLFDPVYGTGTGPLDHVGTKKLHDQKIGLYFQDQMKIHNQWVVVLGGRQDWSKNDNRPAGANEWTKEQSDAFTARLGLVYLADNGIAPFFSYSQSFEPTAGIDRNGTRLKPSEGEQFELGVRYQPEGINTSISAAIYQLTKSNVSVTDPVNTLFTVQNGKVRSRGFELEAKTKLDSNTNLTAAYAYTDARNIKSSPLTPELDDSRTGGVPFNQLSLWADQEFSSFGAPGFKLGAGLRYVGSTRGSYVDAEVPSYTLIDAMASYTTGSWKMALNATNLADKYYVASCTYGCFYGEPRKILATATYRW
jgi:iron complex outermembrane recepter protein